MQNLQHILTPTDFSDSANTALVYALNLAERINSKLHILHVSNENNRMSKDEIQANFDVLKYNYLSRSKVEVMFYTEEGAIKNGIDKVVNQQHIDLIVIGMQGASYQEKSVFGSLTSALITDPPCAVLSLPRGCMTLSLKHIAVTSDLYSIPSLPEVYVLTFLAEVLDSKVSIFHVDQRITVPYEGKVKQRFDELFRYNVHSFHEITSGNFISAVNDFTTEQNVDIITVFHKLKLRKDPRHRSIAKQLTFATKKPLLIIPIQGG